MKKCQNDDKKRNRRIMEACLRAYLQTSRGCDTLARAVE